MNPSATQRGKIEKQDEFQAATLALRHKADGLLNIVALKEKELSSKDMQWRLLNDGKRWQEFIASLRPALENLCGLAQFNGQCTALQSKPAKTDTQSLSFADLVSESNNLNSMVANLHQQSIQAERRCYNRKERIKISRFTEQLQGVYLEFEDILKYQSVQQKLPFPVNKNLNRIIKNLIARSPQGLSKPSI